MKLYFRELTYEDIPRILEISKDIWEGEDYIPYVIDNWMKSKNCMNYGAFLDEEKKDIVGFGRVKVYQNRVAWFEGGRVSIAHQRRGIGMAMMKYAIDYAYQVGAKIAQYDTSTENLGSLSIAKFFGFKRKKSMYIVGAKRVDIKLRNDINSRYEEISLVQAKDLYKRMDIGPGNEVCVGWQFIPLEFLKDEDGIWISNWDSILHVVSKEDSKLGEVPSEEEEIWMIVYGKPTSGRDLIQTFLSKSIKTERYNTFEVFCNPETAELLLEIGFSYYEGEPFGVVLFEKNLRD